MAADRPPSRIRQLFRRVRWPAASGALATLAGWFALPWCLPLPAGLTAAPPRSPVLLDRHGEPLHHLVLPDSTRSAPVELARIPADFIACTLAAEDKRFPDHGGVDLLAVGRSAGDALRHGRAVSGASTITQQLVKLASPPARRNLRTKLREALIARRLEMSWPKDRILAAYFDRLHYGNRRTSPAEAARFYFQKPLGDLSLAECALLAGLPQAPSRLDPLRHPERALARRDVVLQRLAATGKYDTSRISAALAEPLRLHPLREKPLAPWLPALAGREGEAAAGPLTTSLDAALQRDVEAIVREELAKLAGSNLRHAAVIVLHNPTGEILAWVASGNWDDPRGGQINGALIPRSPGSALKPFTWLLTFEQGGLQPGSIVADIPTRFRTEQGLDAPENYDRGFRGPVTVRQALACSLNVPAMRALNDLGGPRPLFELLQRLELETLGPDPAPYGLGLTLGNAPVRLLDLTNAYATLARGGRFFPPTLTLRPSPPATDAAPLFDPRAAYLIADILADPLARAPSFGRNGPLELPFRCAAKTGTSSDFRDNWCLGFTRDFTVGVWAGNFDNSPMKGLSGVAGAGPIFHRTLLRLHRDTPPQWLARPPGLQDVRLDARTGKALPPGADGTPELVPADRLPLPQTAADYDAEGRVLLDSSYSEWFASEANRRRSEFALAGDRPPEDPLRILAPREGSRYVIDPELPNGGVLRLATNLPGSARWSCDTLTLVAGGAEPSVRLLPGRHTLVATDTRNGGRKEVTITVEER